MFLDNPDRGIYIQIASDRKDKIERVAQEENLRMILLAFDLSGYEEQKVIDNEKINELEMALKTARNNYLSVIFRAAYSFDDDYREPRSISNICNHIKQISSVLQKYTDIVVCVQAGMIGPYGEWHSSKYVEADHREDLDQVILTWAESLPEEIALALRTPTFVKYAMGLGISSNRLTVHNDALLSNDTDMGTYTENTLTREEQIQFIGSCIPVYMGGEMTNVSQFTEINSAVNEFNMIKINYLNRYYNEKVWNEWAKVEYENQPADKYIMNYLGYRLSIDRVKLLDLFLKDQVKINVKNSGFGKLDPRFQFYLWIEKEGKTTYYPMEKKTDENQIYLKTYIDRIKDRNVKMGLKITRKDPDSSGNKECIHLANEGIDFIKGINYFLNIKINKK